MSGIIGKREVRGSGIVNRDTSLVTSVSGSTGVVADSDIDHDSLANFAANEHYTQANITALGTVTSGTLGSGVVFPAGHILRSFYDQDAGAAFTVSSDASYSLLDVTITGTNSTSDFIEVMIMVSSVYNSGSSANSLYTGCSYSTNDWVSETPMLLSATTFRLMRMGYVGSAMDHMQSGCLIFRVNHPTTSTYRIRPYFSSAGTNSIINQSHGRSTMCVHEIKG